jgi:biotin operon repressor
MRSDSHRPQVLDAFRTLSERHRRPPTFQQLGDAVGISAVAAWKNVQALVHDGKIYKIGSRYELAEDSGTLVLLSTDALRAELARRGVTMDALERAQAAVDEGRPCAANGCRERVGAAC